MSLLALYVIYYVYFKYPLRDSQRFNKFRHALDAVPRNPASSENKILTEAEMQKRNDLEKKISDFIDKTNAEAGQCV